MRKLSKLMALLLVTVLLLMLMPVAALANEEATVDETVIVEQTAEEEPVVEVEPAVDEPVIEEAAAPEQPVIEQAIVEEAVEEPIVEQGIFVVPTLQLIKDAITTIDVLVTNTGDGYDYDPASTTLTLDNFTGEQLLAGLLGDNFAVVLQGTNTLKTDEGFAVYVEGDLNLSGTGTLVAEGQTMPYEMGGGIQVLGDLVIDSGTYEITATRTQAADEASAVGILAGDNDSSVITPGSMVINGGDFKITVNDIHTENTGYGGAFGLYAYGDLLVNHGKFDVETYSSSWSSYGIGAYEDLVFNGGKVRVHSSTDTNYAKALIADKDLVINRGCFDLCAIGGIEPRALYGEEGIYINSCYGEVDTSASCLKLCCCKDECDHHCKVKCAKTACDNPKTGVTEDTTVPALIILFLAGLVIAAIKWKFQS